MPRSHGEREDGARWVRDALTHVRPDHTDLWTGLPYLAMTDMDLLHGRLRIRKWMQEYNNFPWPSPPDEYFGPDERQELLAKVFGITLQQIKQAPIEIEPPFYVDYVSQARPI